MNNPSTGPRGLLEEHLEWRGHRSWLARPHVAHGGHLGILAVTAAVQDLYDALDVHSVGLTEASGTAQESQGSRSLSGLRLGHSFICQSTHPASHPSSHPVTHPSIHPFIHSSIQLTHLPTHQLFTHPPIHPSIHHPFTHRPSTITHPLIIHLPSMRQPCVHWALQWSTEQTRS